MGLLHQYHQDFDGVIGVEVCMAIMIAPGLAFFWPERCMVLLVGRFDALNWSVWHPLSMRKYWNDDSGIWTFKKPWKTYDDGIPFVMSVQTFVMIYKLPFPIFCQSLTRNLGGFMTEQDCIFHGSRQQLLHAIETANHVNFYRIVNACFNMLSIITVLLFMKLSWCPRSIKMTA